MVNLPQVKTAAMRGAIAEALRQALVECRFVPGEAIIESAVAAEMKVSRGPVREALLQLTQEGLVTHSQNHGFSVLKFTESDRDAIDEVRCVLETLAMQLARERVLPADLQALKQTKAQMVTDFQSGNTKNRLQGESDFHGMIWDKSGNQYLSSCLRRICAPYFTYGAAFRMNRPDLTPELLDQQHQLYIDYLEGSSRQTAEDCVRFHLNYSVRPKDADYQRGKDPLR